MAEDVRTMVKGANLLREGVREGEVVRDVLLEPPAAEKMDEETDKKSENKKKLSHFQAMALMGKLFFGLKTKTIEEEDGEEEEEETSYEEEGEESEEEEEEATETESDDRESGESEGGHVTRTQVQVVIEKEDSSRERSPPPPPQPEPESPPVPKITHFQAVALLSNLFAKIRAQHDMIAEAAARGGGGKSSSSSAEWTEPLSASDPSTETGASSQSSRCGGLHSVYR